ncbi:MCE family protein [Amycolatopsis sp. NPDC049253]|uniref:MCE family protein n=1 Tax=Amycolatopsis sp. NPDC049253 TaxID=3155274 RepID=UPI0034196C24
MKAFEERHPVPIGIVGVVVILLGSLAAYFYEDLPVIGDGTRYSAEFSEAAGLASGDEVRIAGVKVGAVKDVSLEHDHVRVAFTAKNAWVGDQTSASIQIKTLLGQKYLALDPEGTSPLDPDVAIPRSRTVSPYDVTTAVEHLSDTVGQIDTRQLAQSFTTISDAFRGTPESLKEALGGLSALSQTVSSRNQQLAALLASTRQVSGILADRDEQFQKLLSDGNLLLGEIQAREQAIAALLSGAQSLAMQVSGLVQDNEAQLKPALDQLNQVTTLLENNQDNLAAGLRNLAPFYRVFTNTLGNGRWFDTYACGVVPPNVNLDLLVVNPEGCLPAGTNSGVPGGN